MNFKHKLLLPVWIVLFSIIGKAQVSVVNLQLMPYNVTPDGLMAASIMNNGNAQMVQLVSKLYNFNNELLITVKSNSFNLKQGLNSPFDGARKVSTVDYTSNQQANYVKTTHGLPSGTFKICINIIQSTSSEIMDEFCDEIESNFNQYLYLVYPADKDTIETSTPLLTWSHSEPFSVLSQGEYYRMVVSEIKDKQGAEEAITINTPLMAKNYVTTHSLQYPYDAKELKAGNHYAWQVQKMANGVITNKTEAWEFVLRKKPEETAIKYVALKHELDGAFYTAYNHKAYFKFSEEYKTDGTLKFSLLDEKHQPVSVDIVLDKEKTNKSKTDITNQPKLKYSGDNRYDLDLNTLNSGYYTLEVRNEKKESFYLKIFLP